jgi:D-glycero-D-manno-heptose 1,7-bisphosphate phosphatase
VDIVILDRDGVINRDRRDFIKSPQEWQPLPGSLEAIARFCAAGYRVAIATNQSGIGRGIFALSDLEAIHAKMLAAVTAEGGRISALEFCPHRPEDGCDCRKPRTGLLQRIATRMGADLAGVPCIGDSARDLQAAETVGARPILVMTGNGRRTLEEGLPENVEVYEDLASAADRLIWEHSR